MSPSPAAAADYKAAANGATSQNFTGDIHGFAATDEIDLRGISYGNPTYASYTYSPTTGMLSVYDGNGDHYDLDIGPGYAGAHFAGSDDTHGGTLITMTADDDLPAFGQTSLTASFDEQQSQTGSGVHDPIPARGQRRHGIVRTRAGLVRLLGEACREADRPKDGRSSSAVIVISVPPCVSSLPAKCAPA